MTHLLVSPNGLTSIKFPDYDQIDAVDGVFMVESEEIAQRMQSKKYGFIPYIVTEEDEEEEETPAETNKMPKFSKFRKPALQDWLTERGVEFDETLNRDSLAVLCIEHFERQAEGKPTEEKKEE